MAAVQIAAVIEEDIRDKATKPIVSLDGDSFESDQKYFEQIPGFMEMLDKELASKKRYSRETMLIREE
jgi:hypothetical protein